ncbi:hypothetical protein N402_03830 [Helicobacter pylori FD423]|nr:hypothetical protein N402_03830 [Helicobacter pylori FD423]
MERGNKNIKETLKLILIIENGYFKFFKKP